MLLQILVFLILLTTSSSINALDFLFNSFNTSDLTLIQDAKVDSSVIRLTNDTNQFSIVRAFYPLPIPIKTNSNNNTQISSFSTSFVFSILPQITSSPGFGLAFVLSTSTSPPGAISGQYFGIFSNSTVPTVSPLLAIEFDTGRNPEFNDLDENHVGIDLNNVESAKTQTAGYYNSSNGDEFVPVNMRNGQNIRVWIEFDGTRFEINVTIAPVGVSKPSKPLLAYRDSVIADYVSDQMFIGFSASEVTWIEPQRILAWSFSDTGSIARDINVTGLPVFLPDSSSSSSISAGAIAGIVIGSFLCISLNGKFHSGGEEDNEIEEWELEYWPHRFSYEELYESTKGFSRDELLGFGGFGKVYKGTQQNGTEVAVKCVSHDSKQGLREFMAEISSMGRLQHKNLVHIKGWCRKGSELMLVYDYLPNGILNWIGRQQVMIDVAEGLHYLHYGWDQVVLHRDIKSSNILLDTEMRGRLGDFGLAKLYQHGQVPGTTRVVGTLGYLAPELALSKCVDVRIAGEYRSDEIERVLKLGLACCHPVPRQRPTMKEVVAVLLGESSSSVAQPGHLLSHLSRNGGSGEDVLPPV
ncbi:hypothetical protein MKX01_029799 [Papaver californicum]|nr:hypothetical protein MKX01_029799 [Papaver californicum]